VTRCNQESVGSREGSGQNDFRQELVEADRASNRGGGGGGGGAPGRERAGRSNEQTCTQRRAPRPAPRAPRPARARADGSRGARAAEGKGDATLTADGAARDGVRPREARLARHDLRPKPVSPRGETCLVGTGGGTRRARLVRVKRRDVSG
jgi:hypothetical protein